MRIASSRGLLLGIAVLALVSCSKSGGPTKGGRPELEVGGVTWRILTGTWKKDGDSLVGKGGHIQSAVELIDGTIEMDIEEEGAVGHTIGVGFRYTLYEDDPARASGYTLNLSPQAFNVFRGANDYWLPVNPDTKRLVTSSIIDARKNHILIRLKGNYFDIDANGAALVNFTDASHTHGHVNLWVETGEQSVRFSNIHVTKG
jgi:hypothetical protein